MTGYFRFFLKWQVVVAVCYFAVLLLELKIIFPIERLLLADVSSIVSLVFLPHAVRVLSTVIYGPKVFFVLFPTILISGYFLFGSYGDGGSWSLTIDAASGAGCAPLAYIAVRWANRENTTFHVDLQNWKMVFLIGAVASVLNSVLRTAFLSDANSLHEIFHTASRVIFGDMAGLLTGLIVIVFAFRFARRGQI